MSLAGVLLANTSFAQARAESLRDGLLNIAIQGPARSVGGEQVSSLVALMGLEVSTAPLGTSTGGFTFTFDPQTGAVIRSSQSFGPLFAERSVTTGKGRFSAGFNILHAGYSSVADMDVEHGNLLLARNTQAQLFPSLWGATLDLTMSSDTLVAFTNIGVTNDLDVGVAIPWVRVSLGAEEVFVDAAGVDLEAFGRPHLRMPKTTATGIGDVAVFGKYRFWRHEDGGLSGRIEVRLPTGAEKDLRGVGVTRTLLSAIWSRGGRVAPHANIGYEIWSDDVDLTPSRGVTAKNQLRYTFGVEVQPHLRVTAVVDLVGRRLLHGGRPEYERFTFEIPDGGSFEALVASGRALDVVSLAPGIKWNVYGNVLLTANVLVALENRGLRADVVPVMGLDWTF